MKPEFIAHNVRLDDGSYTRSPDLPAMDAYPWFVSTKRLLDTLYPGDRSKIRIADLGCLEGGYATEFARLGFDSMGLEVRESNMAACEYVKASTNLPNLRFVRDDAWNLAKYGSFDIIFCCGLLYHFDRPRAYVNLLGQCCTKLLLLRTHFAVADDTANTKHPISKMAEQEGLPGRWYREKIMTDQAFTNREQFKLASWDNRTSFWVQREYLLQTIREAGFDMVMEQFDDLEGNIADQMLNGYYRTDGRGTFIGIKS